MKHLLSLLLLLTLSVNAQKKDCIYDIEEKTDEESIVWITRGTCATGWLPAKSVHYFAD